MYGDFSRDSFRPDHHYRRVLMQQGRVLLDADFNEQAAILLHYHQALTRALAGPFAAVDDGFKLTLPAGKTALTDLELAKGQYFVDGLICELDQDVPLKGRLADEVAAGTNLLYLAAWERHVDPCEDEALADPALGGAEAMGRSKVEWRVRAKHLTEALPAPVLTTEAVVVSPPALTWSLVLTMFGVVCGLIVLTVRDTALRERADAAIITLLVALALLSWLFGLLVIRQPSAQNKLELPASRGQQREALNLFRDNFLNAIDTQAPPDPPALTLGPKILAQRNQLYRVEIHRGGQAGEATFKWSRGNGAATFRAENATVNELELTVTITDPHRDAEMLREDKVWVELVDPAALPAHTQGQALPLFQVRDHNPLGSDHKVALTLAAQDVLTDEQKPLLNAPGLILRVWDHRAAFELEARAKAVGATAPVSSVGQPPLAVGGALKVTSDAGRLAHELEDGLTITFDATAYAAGDYWLFEVRRGKLLSGSIPGRPGARVAYAPLAIVTVGGAGVANVEDRRLVLAPQVGPPAGAGAAASPTAGAPAQGGPPAGAGAAGGAGAAAPATAPG